MHASELEPAAARTVHTPDRRRATDAHLSTPSALLTLQRLAGNESVNALLAQKRDEDREDDSEASPVLDVVGSGGGSPLDPGARSFLENRLGSDFSDVRVHTGAEADRSARSINAHAYTAGTDVVFRAGAYQPDAPAGRHVLAHELAHVIQQKAGPVDGTPAPGGIRLSHPSDAFEQAAERAADDAMTGTAPTTPAGGQPAPVQREGEDEEEEEVQALAVQRDDAPAGPLGAVQQPAATGEWTQERNEMEDVRARATARQLQSEACVGLATDVLTSLKAHLEGVSTVYGTAYERYSKVIEAGREAAKSEEEWIDIGVSILLAVAIGTGVGAVGIALEIPEAVAAEAAKEAITATATEAGKYAGKHTGLLEVVGTNLEPGGLKPPVMKLKLWEQLVDLHRSVLKTINQADMQSLIASGAEYAIGEIKAQVGGGAGADLDVATLHGLIGTLAADDAASAGLDARLSTAIGALQGVKASLASAPSPFGREGEMERDIWILWMAELSEDEAKVLDRDPIEDHLEALGFITSHYGSGGSLGVDTGIWTTENDCLEMIEAARGEAGALRQRYGSIAQ
jgi:hypothetical protein